MRVQCNAVQVGSGCTSLPSKSDGDFFPSTLNDAVRKRWSGPLPVIDRTRDGLLSGNAL